MKEDTSLEGPYESYDFPLAAPTKCTTNQLSEGEEGYGIYKKL